MLRYEITDGTTNRLIRRQHLYGYLDVDMQRRCLFCPRQVAADSAENLTIQNIMQLAGAAVDLLDVQGSSVMVCLEDGWDITAQIVSVAQVLLDPYYRTIEGFRTIIEKEWLAFGHRFSYRGNHTVASQSSGFAPIFLQFLDVVHQVHSQFPLSFEFNQYFLRFIALHYCSGRFRTFLLDSEYERVEAGWLLDERVRSHSRADELDDVEGDATLTQAAQDTSMWEYIEKHHKRSPLFFNPMYITPSTDVESRMNVLRPYSNISNLRIWDYYVTEELGHYPSYDREMVAVETQQEEEQNALETSPSNRKIVMAGYDNLRIVEPDAFTLLLEEVYRLETELGHLPQRWKYTWDKQQAQSDYVESSMAATQQYRSHGRAIHKRATIEILIKGKMGVETTQMYSHPHRFEKFNYTTPTYCDYCNHVLWGLVKTGMRCVDCGYNCHEKCQSMVPKNCTRYKSVNDGVSSASLQAAGSGSDNASIVTSGVGTLTASGRTYYDQFSSNVGENSTHEGYLYKRGALLKGWKMRWFVLDSIKHQLRYYDTMEDSHCKGFIDLAEVISASLAQAVAGAPKKANDKSFFEVKTKRRDYSFVAHDQHSHKSGLTRFRRA
ncbi:PREDICTED: myotubularin-related protein 13-like [Priapulus caudatus]|uniref:Myotubularin-related protein 13-like n=1 Tax=Priapulus caudatus TaxID=37621 RepID=A0ABM1F950_PRICU|nr:PREDICTED: myotubularin-related protein 13-like [Priapulus caudatus]